MSELTDYFLKQAEMRAARGPTPTPLATLAGYKEKKPGEIEQANAEYVDALLAKDARELSAQEKVDLSAGIAKWAREQREQRGR
jgi:hypothetical protein